MRLNRSLQASSLFGAAFVVVITSSPCRSDDLPIDRAAHGYLGGGNLLRAAGDEGSFPLNTNRSRQAFEIRDNVVVEPDGDIQDALDKAQALTANINTSIQNLPGTCNVAQHNGLWLCPIEDQRHRDATARPGLLDGFSLGSYLQLVDWTSRMVRKGKAHVSRQVTALLKRLGTTKECWTATMQEPSRDMQCSTSHYCTQCHHLLKCRHQGPGEYPMTVARTQLVDVSVTPWYHVISKTVRGARLLCDSELDRHRELD